MTMISEPTRLSLEALILDQGQRLVDELAMHRLASFPPSAAKEFRRLTPAEAAHFLGVNDSYLRQTAATIKGLALDNNRRAYSLDDLNAVREAMAVKSRNPVKFVPRRRGGEHLQLIAVVNFKGGSAKTTTAANLAQYLALSGYRTLAIDLDPQASLTTLFGIAPEASVGPGESLYGSLRFDGAPVPIQSVIRKTYIPKLDVVPGALELMEYEHEAPRALADRTLNRLVFTRVAEALGPIADDYDVVVIDCPPQLGYLTLAGLIASTSILITVHPQMLDVMSMAQFLIMLGSLLDTVAKASGRPRSNYDWLRYLITRFEPSDGPQSQMAAFLRMIFGDYVLKNPTVKSSAISDAGITSQTIYEIERAQVTRSTYDRALESVNSVNAEILGLIRSAWGRK